MNWQAPLAHRYASTSHGSHAVPEHLDSLVTPQSQLFERDALIDHYVRRFVAREDAWLPEQDQSEGRGNGSLAFDEILRTVQERIFDIGADSFTEKLYLRASNSVIIEQPEEARRYTTLVKLTDNGQQHIILTQGGLYVVGCNQRPAYTAVSLQGGKNQSDGGYLFEPIISQDVFDALCYGLPDGLHYYQDDMPVNLQILIDSIFQHPKIVDTCGPDANYKLAEVEMTGNAPLRCKVQIGRKIFHIVFRYDAGFIQPEVTRERLQPDAITKLGQEQSGTSRMNRRRSEEMIADGFLDRLRYKSNGLDSRLLRSSRAKAEMQRSFKGAMEGREIFPRTVRLKETDYAYLKHVALFDKQMPVLWRMLARMSDHRDRIYLPTMFGLHRIHGQALVEVDYLIRSKEVVTKPLMLETTFETEIDLFRKKILKGRDALLTEFPYLYGRILEGLRDQGHLFDPYDLEDIQLVSQGNRQDVATVSLQFEGKSFEAQVRLPRDHYEPVVEFDDLSMKE